jgi:hypothetical protein
MKLNKPNNSNYAATVVALDKFVDLPNCANVKAAIIMGNHVIVGKDCYPGDLGLFFPVETQLMRIFLSYNNLYRKAEFGNINTTKVGFFEPHGRVKCMKFRGHKSEGFWLPISSLDFLGYGVYSQLRVGDTFDTINDVAICKKYVPKCNSVVGSGKNVKARQPRLEDKFVPGQFNFHIDTENLRKNIHKINPWDTLSITDKWHGTSAVIANVLTRRQLRWWEKVLVAVGVPITTDSYGYAWSSRKVVKGVNGQAKDTARHFYGEDVWGVVAKELEESVEKGITLYGEIVGYTPGGGPIQSLGGQAYAYECAPGQHKFVVYRITHTNSSGTVYEFSYPQIKEYCQKYRLDYVKELYYGGAGFFIGMLVEPTDCFSDDTLDSFHEKLLSRLEELYVRDQDCEYNPGLPAEGIVVRVEKLYSCESYKLKSFRFLSGESKELDKGVMDMETQESEENQEASV